ncbi:MAG: T9SS type A sorting domain-containing protein [Flavobacteriales bacterium]|nr:T9SS type A sorting domain-containing protein [Flavobacteriales bacterium]
MKRTIALLAGLLSLGSGLRSQVITITFEATLNSAPIPLDSILVMNLTAGGDTMIYFPDNILVLGSTGIAEALDTDRTINALPNPFASSTEVAVESLGGAARIAIHDVAGRELVSLAANLSVGVHRFRVSCARPGVHLLSVVQGGVRHTMRLMATEGR